MGLWAKNLRLRASEDTDADSQRIREIRQKGLEKGGPISRDETNRSVAGTTPYSLNQHSLQALLKIALTDLHRRWFSRPYAL